MPKRQLSPSSKTPVSKQQKYMTKFNNAWKADFKWCQPSSKGQDQAYCTTCKVDFKICYGGRNDITRHSETPSHKQKHGSISTTPSVASMFTNSNNVDKVTYAETVFANFIADHNLPFMIADHLTLCMKVMFPDSPTAQKFACRRTKTTHIVTQALAPHWDNKVTDMCKEEKFAVMIDESNDKGDNKKLNILVRVYNTTLQKIATHFVGIPTCNIVASLSDRFLSLSPDQKSQLEDQASDYILSPKSDLPPYDKENTTMNQFWQSMAQRKIPSGQPQFDLLFQLSKVMLTIPHSNADTERTFSMLKKIQTDSRDNLESKTIHSLLSIKINNYTDCYLYKPEPSLVRAAKSACTSYQSQCSTTSA